jgi:hypothetical protein
MSDEIQKLQLKVTELENQLKTLSLGRQQVDPEEYKTYQKVTQQLGLSTCISECAVCITCYHCIACIRCIACDVCILNTPVAQGGARFGSLG